MDRRRLNGTDKGMDSFCTQKIRLGRLQIMITLGAIVGYVPDQMVQALGAFMEFCYLVRRSTIDCNDLVLIDAAVAHQDRSVFL